MEKLLLTPEEAAEVLNVGRSTICWQGRVDLGWVDGKRQRKVVYGKTQGEVRNKLRAALQAKANGLPQADERLRLGAWLDRWLTDCITPVRKPSTVADYESKIRVHIVPALGQVVLTRLTPAQVRKAMIRWQDAGMSRAMVKPRPPGAQSGAVAGRAGRPRRAERGEAGAAASTEEGRCQAARRQ